MEVLGDVCSLRTVWFSGNGKTEGNGGFVSVIRKQQCVYINNSYKTVSP